ncbi:MAG TPA: HD domain-containing phosphohydrolase [Chitinispirillaceae bacterium]|nr:HD domain-containing phosphohydrolase [Chitinispirillaceae bacterium]
MVRYSLDQVQDDMVLGESIVLPSGELLLAAGYRIKERYRERLKQLGYRNILIDVEGTEDVNPQGVVTEATQREMGNSIDSSTKELSNVIEHFRIRSTEKIKDILKENKQYLNKYIMSNGMVKALDKFVEEIMSQSSIVLNLSAMQQTQPSLLSHALNVTITSLCIGKKYKLSYEEMKQLGIGALNYELGLVALPKELLAKKITEYSAEELKTYQQHTVYGFLMLSQNHTIPSTSAAVALQHHERQNGTGYPQGIKGDNRPPLKDFSRQNMIHRFAEIVAVADCYDSYISGRAREGIEPNEVKSALKNIIEMGGNLLNADIIKTLTAIIPIFPVGARIKITNAPTPQLIGYYGVIARDNPENLENPQIIIYETKNRQKIKPILIDMAKHKGFTLEIVV